MDDQALERFAATMDARCVEVERKLASVVARVDALETDATVAAAADVLELSRAVECDRATLTDTRAALNLALDRLDALEAAEAACPSMPPDVPDLERALRRIAMGEGVAEDAETIAGFTVRLESRIAQLETHARVDSELAHNREHRWQRAR